MQKKIERGTPIQGSTIPDLTREEGCVDFVCLAPAAAILTRPQRDESAVRADAPVQSPDCLTCQEDG